MKSTPLRDERSAKGHSKRGRKETALEYLNYFGERFFV